MPAKIKPKTQKQVDELIEVIDWKLCQKKPCLCAQCMVNMAFLVAVRDSLQWTQGKPTPNLTKLVDAIKKSKAKEEKHHVAHAE
jgi:hypothetical protein